jgi:molybdopterin converting factor small subunit
MKVTIKLFGALRQYLPAGSSFNSCQVTTTANSMLEEVLAMIPIPEHKAYLVIVNEKKINREDYSSTPVRESDEIVLLPPIKGG